MHHRKLVAGLATLSLVGGGTGVALAAGKPPRRANVVAVSTTKVKINRYIQDGLRWNKDVYTVRSGGTLHDRQQRRRRGAAHVHGRQEADLPKTPRAIFNCKICNKLGEGPRRRPEQRRAAEVPVPRERRRPGRRAPNVDRAGDSAFIGRQEGRRRSTLKVTAKKGTTLLLHVPHPPVDAGQGHGRLGAPLAAPRTRRGPWPWPGPSRLLTAAPAGARVRDYWVAAVPTTWNVVPNGHDAIMDMHVDAADAIFPTVVYRRFTRGLAAGRWPTRRARAPTGWLIPGPLITPASATGCAIHFKNMDTLRRDPHSMHFHGVHYKPSSDGAYLPGLLRARRRRQAPGRPTPTA